jgi:hypothetical protein
MRSAGRIGFARSHLSNYSTSRNSKIATHPTSSHNKPFTTMAETSQQTKIYTWTSDGVTEEILNETDLARLELLQSVVDTRGLTEASQLRLSVFTEKELQTTRQYGDLAFEEKVEQMLEEWFSNSVQPSEQPDSGVTWDIEAEKVVGSIDAFVSSADNESQADNLEMAKKTLNTFLHLKPSQPMTDEEYTQYANKVGSLIRRILTSLDTINTEFRPVGPVVQLFMQVDEVREFEQNETQRLAGQPHGAILYPDFRTKDSWAYVLQSRP